MRPQTNGPWRKGNRQAARGEVRVPDRPVELLVPAPTCPQCLMALQLRGNPKPHSRTPECPTWPLRTAQDREDAVVWRIARTALQMTGELGGKK